jgi:molybdopterin-biosynthesis enzyme MoeA-like protein
MKEPSQIVNRHMARLLADLEEAGCPVIFRECVKSRLQWLRDDLTEAKEHDDRNDTPRK